MPHVESSCISKRDFLSRSCNHEDGQIYTPPYLLNSDGTDAVRPTLTATSRTVAVGGIITATANDTVSVFSLIRRG
jgi:galactose oxidase